VLLEGRLAEHLACRVVLHRIGNPAHRLHLRWWAQAHRGPSRA
jgi:hypothetical protein